MPQGYPAPEQAATTSTPESQSIHTEGQAPEPATKPSLFAKAVAGIAKGLKALAKAAWENKFALLVAIPVALIAGPYAGLAVLGAAALVSTVLKAMKNNSPQPPQIKQEDKPQVEPQAEPIKPSGGEEHLLQIV